MELSRRWDRPEVAGHYAAARWSSARRRDRDARLLARLARRVGVDLAAATVLDAPCGTGRLRGLFGERYVGLDSATAMLREARRAAGAPLVRGDVAHLPLRDRSFEVVVACRLLHHLARPDDLARAVAELVRVADGWVLASFWDAASLPALRRSLRGRRARPESRLARPRAEVRAAFDAAGARVVAFAGGPRLFSQQCFCAARR